MIRTILFVVFVFCFVTIVGQETTSRLASKLKTELDDSVRVKTLNLLGKDLIDRNPDSTRLLAEQSKQLAEKINFFSGMLKANNLIGNVLQRKGKADSALIYYSKALEIAEQTNDIKGFAMVLNNIGIVELNKGEYAAALQSYFKAYDYEKQLNDTVGMAQAFNNIGIAHYYMSDLDNTLKYLKKSMVLTEQVGDLQVLKKGYINIGAIHQHLREYDEALEFYHKGLEISKQLNDKNDLNIARHNLAQIHIAKKEFNMAEEYIRTSLAYQEETGNQKGIAIENNYLGNLYREKGQIKKAEEFYLKAIEICRKGGFLKDLESSYNELSKLYSSNGQYKAALESAQKYIVLKDSLLNLENSRTFAELRTKYETVEKEKELAEEKVKSESLAKESIEAKLSTENRNKWIVVLLAVIIAVSLLFLVKRQQNKRKAQADKDAAIIAEQEKAVNAVFEMQEEERKRISKDLHDGLGQQFAALKMAVNRVEKKIKPLNEVAANELNQVSAVLQSSAEELRSISHAMMPRVLTEVGLVAALEGMLATTLTYSNIKYSLESYDSVIRFEEKIEVGLYRVSQELINNIIKHSKASKVTFQISMNQNFLELKVQDDGIGMNSSSKNGHGLLNMKSRVNSLNGSIRFDSQFSKGTKVVVQIPIV